MKRRRRAPIWLLCLTWVPLAGLDVITLLLLAARHVPEAEIALLSAR